MIRSISRCLNHQLRDLCQRTVQLDELNSKVQANLPRPLQDHCTAGSFNRGCLSIVTTNAAWATELRYRLPDLRDALRKAGLHQLSSIKITVSDLEQPIIKKNKQMVLSSVARDSLETASALCSYQPLKDALYRLAIQSEQN